MTNSQEQFLKDKPLSEWWTAIVAMDNFQRVMVHCRSALTESISLTPDKLDGINALAGMLTSICETQEPESPRIESKLTHDLTVKRKTPLTK